jgi:hypothetical protein
VSEDRDWLQGVLRQNTNLRVVIAAGIAVIGGVALLYGGSKTSGSLAAFCGGLGATLVSVGVVALIYEIWLRRSVVTEFLQASNLRTALADWGILDIQEFSRIDWMEFFDQKSECEISFGYGRTWSTQHAETLLRAAVKSETRVSVMILDPGANPDVMNFYARVYETDVSTLQLRIAESIQVWTDAWSKVQGAGETLRIEGCDRPVNYSYYRSGDRMWVVLAPRQAGRSSHIPALLCSHRGKGEETLYGWVSKDIEGVRNLKRNNVRELWPNEVTR